MKRQEIGAMERRQRRDEKWGNQKNVGSSVRRHGDYANEVYRPNHHIGVNSRFHQDRGRYYYPSSVISQRGILGSKPPLQVQSFHLPHPFKKSFSSLFPKQQLSKQSASIKQATPISEQEDGWTQVINRKRRYINRKSSLVQASPPESYKPKRCFLCGNHNHLAKSCKMTDIVCFRCNTMGHKARECPTAVNATPIVTLPPIIKEHILNLSSYAIFYVCRGNPSLSDLREMLSFKFNTRNWPHRVVRAGGKSFLVQFPDSDMLEQAEDLKLVDMGGFKGRFLRWREDLGQKILPAPILTWVQIDYLPYHLWEWEFLKVILGDIGECVSCSNDVVFRSHFSNCKVLIKVRDLSQIPAEIRFRSFSPFDNSLLEGWATIKVIGKPIKERDFDNKPEVREHVLKWEGEESSSSGGWVDRSPDEEDSVQSPMITGQANMAGEKAKGILVIPQFSNSKKVGSADSFKESPDLAGYDQQERISLPLPANPLSAAVASPDITEVFWNGNPIMVERNQWVNFLKIQGVGGSKVPHQQGSDLPLQRVSASSSESSKGTIQASSNSMSVPPGFEEFAKSKKMKITVRSRMVSNPITANKYRRFLAASRSRGSSAKRGKSPSASFSLPINDKSVADITSISANCGLKEPIPLEGILKIKSLEAERSKGV